LRSFICLYETDPDARRVKVGAGPAGPPPPAAVHRFENFTDDFSVWVMFYGPEGGERV
jgi:hypothetical protein